MSFDIGRMVLCDHIDYTGKSWADSAEVSGCPKCLGENQYYDIKWNSNDGSIRKVINIELLENLVRKSILTALGDNIFHPEYGTSISDSIGTLNTFSQFSRTVEYEVEKMIGQLYQTQRIQIELGQDMTDEELIYLINDIVVRFIDERLLRVDISITSESGRETQVTI